MRSDKNRKIGQRHQESIDQKQAREILGIVEEIAQKPVSKNGSDNGPFAGELNSAVRALRRAVSKE